MDPGSAAQRFALRPGNATDQRKQKRRANARRFYFWLGQTAPYFFFAPTRLMLLIASGVRPDFSAISRSCSMM